MNGRVAVCLRGAVAKVSGTFFTSGSLYREGEYVNFEACTKSIQKHLVEANPSLQMDFFIHCWNKDLQNSLTSLYSPQGALFEDNSLYEAEITAKSRLPNDFSGISHSLSIKKSIELMENHQSVNNFIYDRVILTRPDVILLKDIEFQHYQQDNIYVNGTIDHSINADFHFVMKSEYASQFKMLYNSIEKGNPCRAHFWMKNYINNYMGQTLYEDALIAGVDEEVLRKIHFTTICQHKVPLDRFLEYGLTRKEILSYDKP